MVTPLPLCFVVNGVLNRAFFVALGRVRRGQFLFSML